MNINSSIDNDDDDHDDVDSIWILYIYFLLMANVVVLVIFMIRVSTKIMKHSKYIVMLHLTSTTTFITTPIPNMG